MHPMDGSGAPRTQPRAFMRHASTGNLGSGAAAAAVPPSTAIRSRFRALGEQLGPPPSMAGEGARGTKRMHMDDSPLSKGMWTGGGGGSTTTPMRMAPPVARRLFGGEGQSPARDTMDAERARFELHQVEMERERDREAALRARLDLEAQLAEAVRRAEKMDRDRRWLADQDARRAEARRLADDEAARRLAECEAESEALREQCRLLEMAAGDAARRMRAMMADHRREVDEMRERTLDHAFDRDVDHDVDRTVDKSDRVEDVPDRVADARDRVADAPDRVADAPDRVAQLERDVAEQCAYIRAAEAQNRGLRADVRRLSTQAAQADAQREAAHALQAKVARLEAQLAARADGDAQLAQLLEERRVWAAALATSPVAAAHAADAQRRAIAGLEAQAAERQAALDDAAAQLEGVERRLEEVMAQAAEQAARVARLEEERVGQRAQLQRAACEADFLRAQLASYDAEDARLLASYDEPKAARIRQLELFVDQQRAWLRGEARDALPDLAPLLQGARDDAEHARAELRVARERCDALERDAARLEHQLGAGLGFNPRTTRILQLRDNPAARDYAIRSERLDALAAENAALVDRMRALSSCTAEATKDASKTDSKDTSKDDSPLFCTIDNLRKDNDALATQLRESAKLMARYKKQWKRQAAQLRDTVYRVLGFRVDFLASGAVRFTSTYAQDIDHNFVFSPDPHNPAQMRMIGGACKPYLQDLMNDMRFWVQERGSIPGFMATVTLQNFEARPVGSSDPLPPPPPPIED